MIGAMLLMYVAAAAPDCSFPNGDRTSAKEMTANIRREKGLCGLPWRALKRVVAEPAGRQQIDAAYDALASEHPERSGSAATQKAYVAAAAGHPEAMLSIADANVRDHPEDKSLANMSCFARGRYGFDVDNAMPYCNAAVDGTGRQGWTLVNRGRVELALGLYKEALADFNEALGNREMREMQHKMLVDAAYGRGIARLKLGDAGGAADTRAAIAARSSVVLDFEDAGIRP